MERKTNARKTAATPKSDAAPKTTARKPRAAKSSIDAPKTPAKRTTARKTTPAKSAPAKSAPAKTTTRVATGPTPERIRLAGEVAKLRAKGTKWNEIAATTGKSEPTLAKLRKDVRAGVFANVSPVSARVPADAF